MSSAAVQSSSSPLSNRQYQSRDPYYSQQQPPSAISTSSPASSRKPVQRSASSGNGTSPHTPQHPNQQSPVESSGSSLTPRAHQYSTSANASPIVPSSTAPSNMISPNSLPVRTSSNRPSNASAAAAVLDQQTGQLSMDSHGTSSRGGQGSSSGYTTTLRDESTSAAAAANAAQSRRRAQQSPREAPRHASSSGRSKQSPAHSRSANAVGQPPVGTELPREESTIVNRIVVTDPQEDVAREKARMAEAQPVPVDSDRTPATGLGLVGSEGVEDGGRGVSKPQEKPAKTRKEMKFGEYVLGQTLGEGEFGKVKMGWKRDGGVQVAIKLIRKESLGNNPSRLPKIYREINILRDLQHPNIVRLHEMVETQRHIGIILEYASGGELFDYILNHRYLKDQAARRLFAQLVSGVGYLHKKGIVHRDLKLENLLLDRNRNIIITDFGFANTFNPNDELGEEVEYRLTDKDYIKKAGLDRVLDDGHRRGDLMQTSCGSPCYAAPELVVSDTLYTGRKVDVWSCGVILYAMLAGYLPFDDDPANPEGDNINLLYKYIVSTPLTFPEYVTPHARDLLKRILVPDPRKRADLFEVARHSWLSEYAHVVEFITSSTTTHTDIANTAIRTEDVFEAQPKLGRSASVREPTKTHMPPQTVVGGLQKSQAQVDERETERPKGRDTKRRTVQVEYVAPQSSTVRGEAPSDTQAAASRSRARPENPGPIEVPATDGAAPARMQQRGASAQQSMPPPARPQRDVRAISDSTAFTGGAPASAPVTSSRPATGGSMTGGTRLPSRGNSYSQPATATIAPTNAQGHFSQPKGKPYTISQSAQQLAEPQSAPAEATEFGRFSTSRPPVSYRQDQREDGYGQRSHKRSSTLSGITDKLLGRTGSVKSNRTSMEPGSARPEKQGKSYPPTSMKQSVPAEDSRRTSSDSRRTSFSFGRKNTADSNGGTYKEKRNSRRFSLLKVLGGKKDDSSEPASPMYSRESIAPDRRGSVQRGHAQQRSISMPKSRQGPGMAFGRGTSRTPSESTMATQSTIPVLYDSALDRRRGVPQPPNTAPGAVASQSHNQPDARHGQNDLQYASHSYDGNTDYYHANSGAANAQQQQQGGGGNQHYDKPLPFAPQYPSGFDSDEPPMTANSAAGYAGNRLQKPHRRFNDAYEDDLGKGGHAGSSGPARRVMDVFRRMGMGRNRFEGS